MIYVLDTNVISCLHKNYYRSRFISLWNAFDQLVAGGKITSTREAYRELHDGVPGADTQWAAANEKLFTTPDAKEGTFVGQIYSVAHFQANIERQKLFRGGRNADAFIVARAYATDGTVVTKVSWKVRVGSSEQPRPEAQRRRLRTLSMARRIAGHLHRCG